ncbi:MAG: fimbria major subunit [Duncaniella sp.]|nr:fimbria major subunit [Duncaniella sp.]
MPDGDETSKLGFRIWRYVTENTLTATASQKKGISTGIIFKAEILTATDAKESNLSKAINAGEVVYGYNGTFYGNVEALREAADNQTQESKFRVKFEKVFPGALDKIEVDGKLVFKNEITDCTAEANYIEEDGAGAFKILRPTTEKDGKTHYYVYYLYRNRHNDNSNNSLMRTMEFATVRNNVYKLYVDKISNFGHTDNPKDDPDPEDPDDPDEDDKVYFKVSCYVVPWMVRVNSIEF